MTAVLGGLVAACAWAASSLCGRRSSRLIGAYSAVAWVMLAGFFVLGPAAALLGVPDGMDAAASGWIALGGGGAVAGLVCMYSALRVGKLGVVAPIAATEGAIAALIAVAFGERIGLGASLVLAGIVAGVLLASMARSAEGVRGAERGAWLAAAAAVLFGASLYGVGRAGDDVGAVWTLLGARIVALAVLVLPLLLLRRLRFERAAAPYVIGSGLLELAGGVAFIVGAGDSIAVSSVVASQYAAIVVVAGYVLVGERLGRAQAAGVGAVLAGVAVLAGLQA